MNTKEQTLLLLSSHLEDRSIRPLNSVELHVLEAVSGEAMSSPTALNDFLTTSPSGLLPAAFRNRISFLLNRIPQLDAFLEAAECQNIRILTQLSPEYPRVFLNNPRAGTPSVLFCRGDLGLLQRPAVSLVGSRNLNAAGQAFAERTGQLAAAESLVLVSGGARGADTVAQNSCLARGGSVIVFVADRLIDHPQHDRTLFISLDGWNIPFHTGRAYTRNRLIHSYGLITVVAQTAYNTGGTWSGSMTNLRLKLSPVFCHEDGSDGAAALISAGAYPLSFNQLHSLQTLISERCSKQLSVADITLSKDKEDAL